jgi:nucleoside-diphosphate-sugar epimerase
MEELVHRIADGHSSITILRPPAVYGPREDQIYSFFKLVSKRICPIVGDGEHPKISMVYVADVVSGILKAVDQRQTGIHTYFISGKNIHTWNEIRGTTSRVLGKKFVKRIAGIVEKTASFFGSYPVINKEKANEMILEWTCTSKKAERELDYQPRYSLAEGISRTIHWYKMHHWL